MGMILLILLVIGLIIAALAGFGVLLIVMLAKAVAFPFRRRRAKRATFSRFVQPIFYCSQIRCHTANPASARYCRRCGAPAQPRVFYRMSYLPRAAG